MKKIITVLGSLSLMVMISAPVWAQRKYRDYWNNSYKYYDRLWLDTDRDGIINYYDYNDRNSNIWSPYQRWYTVNPYTTEFSPKYRNRKRNYYYQSW